MLVCISCAAETLKTCIFHSALPTWVRYLGPKEPPRAILLLIGESLPTCLPCPDLGQL